MNLHDCQSKRSCSIRVAWDPGVSTWPFPSRLHPSTWQLTPLCNIDLSWKNKKFPFPSRAWQLVNFMTRVNASWDWRVYRDEGTSLVYDFLYFLFFIFFYLPSGYTVTTRHYITIKGWLILLTQTLYTWIRKRWPVSNTSLLEKQGHRKTHRKVKKKRIREDVS